MFLAWHRSEQSIRLLRICVYLIAFGKPAGHREVAPREFDVHSRWKPARAQKRKEGEEEERKTKTKP